MSKALNPLLLFACLCGLILTCLLGSTPLAMTVVAKALVGLGDPLDIAVIWQIRLPRGVNAFVVGFALGVSGAALQGLLRNPLAEPGVLGVSATAALGATLVIYYGLAASSVFAVPLAAIMGALVAAAVVAFTAQRSSSVVTLILVGVGLSSFASAAMSLMMNFAPHPFSLAEMVSWMLGSVANRSFDDLLLAAPFLLAGSLLLFYARHGLVALTLGEEAAYGLGVNLQQQKLLIVVGTGLATGAAVALAGAIGFIGIVAPHLVRPWVAYNASQTLLPSGLMAGLILLLADVGVRVLPTNGELKLGVVAALLGAPVFIWIAVHRGKKSG